MNRVVITRPFAGLASMQVCAVADATDEEILEECNAGNSSGTTNGWTEVVREDGQEHQRPCQCEEHADRVHFMVNC